MAPSTTLAQTSKLERFARAIAQGKASTWTWAASALTLFYMLTAASNLAETDDVYEFAYRAENLPASEVSDPRLMLYHMLMRAFYLAVNALSPDARALWIMRTFSALCAAALLLLVIRVLVNAFKVPAATAALTAAALAVSYGLWRYAAEAEVYIPAMLLTLMVFERLTVSESSFRHELEAGALAGLAVLFYQPNVIPLLMAFPVLLVRRGQFRTLGNYLAVAIAVSLAGYAAGFCLYWHEPMSLVSAKAFLAQRSSEFIVPALSVKTVIVSMVRSAFAFGHDVIAATWLFGFETAVNLIQRAFSANVIHEEVYLASRSGWLRFVPLLVLPILGALLITGLLRSTASSWRRTLTSLWTQPLLTTVLVWVALQAAVIGRLNPAGIEAWIVVLLPASLLLGATVIAALDAREKRRWVCIAVTLLFVHNLFGGMAMTWNADLELDRARAHWVLHNARSDDLLVVAENAGFAEFLRYRTVADVALIRSRDAPALALTITGGLAHLFVSAYHRNRAVRNAVQLARQSLAAGGRIIVFADFFREDPLSAKWHPPFHGRDREHIDAFRSQLDSVWQSPQLGATYVYPGNGE